MGPYSNNPMFMYPPNQNFYGYQGNNGFNGNYYHNNNGFNQGQVHYNGGKNNYNNNRYYQGQVGYNRGKYNNNNFKNNQVNITDAPVSNQKYIEDS
jgi:hypothetical protein